MTLAWPMLPPSAPLDWLKSLKLRLIEDLHSMWVCFHHNWKVMWRFIPGPHWVLRLTTPTCKPFHHHLPNQMKPTVAIWTLTLGHWGSCSSCCYTSSSCLSGGDSGGSDCGCGGGGLRDGGGSGGSNNSRWWSEVHHHKLLVLTTSGWTALHGPTAALW